MKQVIKNLDAFPRAEDHLLQKTQSGAVGKFFDTKISLMSPYKNLYDFSNGNDNSGLAQPTGRKPSSS